MPSSKDLRRIEIPTHLYERLAQTAKAEDRTVSSVARELIYAGLLNYRPTWVPGEHLHRLGLSTRRALDLAKEEAQHFNHNYIGTEHLLLGLLREQDGVAAHALERLGVQLNVVGAAVDKIIGRGEHPAIDPIEYVPRVRKVLAVAVDEAQALGHQYVGTEHLLLGLAREGEGIAAGFLQSLGVLGKVRGETLALLQQKHAGGAAPADQQDQG